MPGIAGARNDSRRQHDVVETAQVLDVRAPAEPHVDAEPREARAVIPQRLGELFLAGNAPREVELSADLGGGIEQRHVVTALGGRHGARHPGWAGADHRDLLHRRRLQHDHRFVAGKRIDEARRDLALEDLVEAGLVAADAGVDFVGAIPPPCSRTPGRRGTAAPSTPCRRRRARSASRPSRDR